MTRAVPSRSPRHRLALLTWAALYPVLTTLVLAVGPALQRLPVPVRTLVISGVVVAAMTYGVMPPLTRACARWLAGPAAGRPVRDRALAWARDPMSGKAAPDTSAGGSARP